MEANAAEQLDRARAARVPMSRLSVVCLDCGRRVRAGHPDCDGDPRATCAIYGCGLAVVGPYVAVEDDYRPTVWLRYCEEHSPVGNAQKALVA